MKKSFRAWLTYKLIKLYKINLIAIQKKLINKRKNKNIYKLPSDLKFPKKIQIKKYNSMEVFEMKKSNQTAPIIMYIHGGGYYFNFFKLQWKFIIDICEKTKSGLSAPNYLLMPKYNFEESNEEMLFYYKKITKKNNMDNVILIGDSAGAGYALSIILQAKKLKLPLPKKMILISPWTVIEGKNLSSSKTDLFTKEEVKLFGKNWRGKIKKTDYRVSPYYGDFKNLPQTQIYTGTGEVLYKDIISLYKKMKEANVEVELIEHEELGHIYPLLSKIPEAKKAKEKIIEFIKK